MDSTRTSEEFADFIRASDFQPEILDIIDSDIPFQVTPELCILRKKTLDNGTRALDIRVTITPWVMDYLKSKPRVFLCVYLHSILNNYAVVTKREEYDFSLLVGPNVNLDIGLCTTKHLEPCVQLRKSTIHNFAHVIMDYIPVMELLVDFAIRERYSFQL